MLYSALFFVPDSMINVNRHGWLDTNCHWKEVGGFTENRKHKNCLQMRSFFAMDCRAIGGTALVNDVSDKARAAVGRRDPEAVA